MIANATRIAVLSRSFSRHAVLRAELSELHPNVTFNDTGRTLAGLGIQPQSLGTILPSYLWRFRAAGQFQRKPVA